MAGYQQARDTHALPIYDFTTQLATLEAPPVEVQHCSAPSTATNPPWTTCQHGRRHPSPIEFLRTHPHPADDGRGPEFRGLNRCGRGRAVPSVAVDDGRSRILVVATT